MLTEPQIRENRELFIRLVKSISIDGADTGGLISFLENSDFFIAPASSQYHGSYKGGLCEHSIKVYQNLIALEKTFFQKVVESGDDLISVNVHSDDTLKIVGLLHDLSKVNFYETYVQNKKVYSPEGKKYDEMGRFDWVAVEAYKVRDAKERMIAGSKGMNSFLIVSRFIPLAQEEIVALVNQYAGSDKTENTEDLSAILGKYNLTVLLHAADLIATFCTQTENE